jgi:YHS domain-containing protein
MRLLFRFVVVPLLVFWLVRNVLRSIFGGMSSQVAAKPARPAPTVSPGGELKKDPVCGTYVSADTSVTKLIDGRTVYFCSSACRDKYRAAS